MNDLDVCKRLAEIVGFEYDILDGFVHANPFTITDIFHCAHTGMSFNPLTDDALCFKLMVKYNVDVMHRESLSTVRIYDDPEDNPIASIDFYRENCDYNKAICLAIIEAHKDRGEV